MKIRQCFVSNSSSSSYYILGIYKDPDDLFKLVDANITKEYMDKENIKSIEEFKDDDPWEFLDYLSKKTKLEYGSGYEITDGVAIGLSPDKMEDFDTLLSFKKKIIDTFATIGIEVDLKDLSFHEDCFMNG